jgi:hypothetical protein
VLATALLLAIQTPPSTRAARLLTPLSTEGGLAGASLRCCAFPVDATSRTPGGANLGLIMMEREMVMAGMELAVTMMI